MMSASLSIHATDNAIDRNGGTVWNRLHSERENICEALLKEWVSGFGPKGAMQRMSEDDAVRTASWHRELLQARLRKIDDALDRLMSGSYGDCTRCGLWIEDSKLDFDPAITLCIKCWQREQSQPRTRRLNRDQHEARLESVPTCDLLDNLTKISPLVAGVALDALAPFDTIWIRTLNTDYRLLLLDPKSGRALVEGGHYFVEPMEALVNGSTFGGSTLKSGWIGVGMRIEMWVNDKLVSTSPVWSVRVEHNTSAEHASAATPSGEM